MVASSSLGEWKSPTSLHWHQKRLETNPPLVVHMRLSIIENRAAIWKSYRIGTIIHKSSSCSAMILETWHILNIAGLLCDIDLCTRGSRQEYVCVIDQFEKKGRPWTSARLFLYDCLHFIIIHVVRNLYGCYTSIILIVKCYPYNSDSRRLQCSMLSKTNIYIHTSLGLRPISSIVQPITYAILLFCSILLPPLT